MHSVIKNFKLFELNEIDPLGEENWNEKQKIVSNIYWRYNNKLNMHGAFVKDVLIGSLYKYPFSKKWNVRTGFRVSEKDVLKDTGEKFNTVEEAKAFVENWWNDFVNKISD